VRLKRNAFLTLEIKKRTDHETQPARRYIMSLRDYGWMMACGGMFLGTKMIATTIILRPEELKVLRKSGRLPI
jgi:hypothetical protein